MKNLTVEFNPVCTKVPFIKEWNSEQFKAMDKAIVKHFKGRKIVFSNSSSGNHTTTFIRGRYSDIDAFLGLAYTSTGIWACYGVCNVSCYFDADCIYQYSYFTIGTDGNFYAVLQDKDENELTILL